MLFTFPLLSLLVAFFLLLNSFSLGFISFYFFFFCVCVPPTPYKRNNSIQSVKLTICTIISFHATGLRNLCLYVWIFICLYLYFMWWTNSLILREMMRNNNDCHIYICSIFIVSLNIFFVVGFHNTSSVENNENLATLDVYYNYVVFVCIL